MARHTPVDLLFVGGVVYQVGLAAANRPPARGERTTTVASFHGCVRPRALMNWLACSRVACGAIVMEPEPT